MVLYPTTVLFRITKTIERALADLYDGLPMRETAAVTMKQFEEIVGITYWGYVENKFKAAQGIALVQRVLQKIAR